MKQRNKTISFWKIFLNVDLATLMLRSQYQPEIICWYTWVILESLKLIAQMEVFFKTQFLIFSVSSTYSLQKCRALFEFYTEHEIFVKDPSFCPYHIYNYSVAALSSCRIGSQKVSIYPYNILYIKYTMSHFSGTHCLSFNYYFLQNWPYSDDQTHPPPWALW